MDDIPYRAGAPLLLAALALTVVSAQPPRFPAEHASQLLDNDRVTIWELEAVPGPGATAHEHASDTLIVSLADGAVTFHPRGTIHGDAHAGRDASRAVAIELKPRSSPGDAAAPGYPDSFPRDGARRLVENDRLIAWAVIWPKGQPTAMHTHPYPTVSVTLEGGHQRETRLDGTINERPVAAGEVRFSDAGRVHQEEGISDVPRRAIVVELK